jgi:pimeloyl-ACP methyl ester carboxylesterase
MDVRRFEVRVTEEVLDGLRERLARTRWPDEVADAGWDYGTNLDYMRELVEYWESSFDWRVQEERLNRFAHFRAEVDGFGVHFIHERGRGDDPMPLVLTHGWPSTFFEFSKIIPLLTDPESHGGDAADAFDVVVPSLPGYGFSDRPKERNFSRRIPGLWGNERIEVPSAVALFPADPPSGMPREWAERSYSDLKRFSRMARGGHFPAMEEPELLAEDIRFFLRPLR